MSDLQYQFRSADGQTEMRSGKGQWKKVLPYSIRMIRYVNGGAFHDGGPLFELRSSFFPGMQL